MCSGRGYDVKIGYRSSWSYPKLYSVAMMDCCAAIGYTNKVKKNNGKSFFHLPAVITHLGDKDCEVKQEMAECMASKDTQKRSKARVMQPFVCA